MAEKYYSRQKENLAARCLKGVGYWFLGNFMCFFMCTTMLNLMRSLLTLKIFISVCTLTITMGLFFNWAHYAAKRDRNAIKFHNMEYDKYMPVKMAVAAPIFPYIMLICLYLSKAGIISDIFSYYIWGNIWILPFITMFTGERTIDAIPWLGIFGITFLVLIQPVTIAVTYICTYNDIDVTKLIFYNNDKK